MKRRIPISEKPRRSKYGVRQDALGKLGRTVDGIKFDSQKEANRYCELKMLEKAGSVNCLAIQVRFALTILDHDRSIRKLGEYVADFVFILNGQHIVEDTKGFRTPLYRWKKRHFEAQYGIEIKEI